jgi:hypothetical protein
MKKKLFKILRKIQKLENEIEVLKRFNGLSDSLEELICIVGEFIVSSNNFCFEKLTDEEKLLLGEYVYTKNSCLGFGVVFHENCERCKRMEEIIKSWNLWKYVKEHMGLNLIPIEIKKEFCIKAILKNKEKIIEKKEEQLKNLLSEINKITILNNQKV